MRILQVCAEIFPLLKTGGLADVAGALPPALAALGDEVRVLLPGFDAILAGLSAPVVVTTLHAPGALSHAAPDARLLYGHLPAVGVDAYVIDAPGLYRRAGGPYVDPYQQPYGDNHLRFALLGWVAAELAQHRDPFWAPDVLHAHDWHAGLAPVYLTAARQAQHRHLAGCVFTVHNLAYQGLFAPHHFGELGLPGHFWGMHGVEYHHQLNFMKGGLYYADRITTVSPTYAREIQGREQGCGLDGLLRTRAGAGQLSGILNGVDDTVWNPAVDTHLAETYDRDDLSGKAACKRALQTELGLDVDPAQPILCVVSRLTEQKGLHLVLQALPELLRQGWQFALIGSGDRWMEDAFRTLAADRPDAVAVRIGYDETFAHRLIAGSDTIAVPSLYEPCGLTQLYGLKYGTLPVVRRVGGLADTVVDTQLDTIDRDATGFVFDDFTAGGLLWAAGRAAALHRRPDDWARVRQRAMRQTFGWAEAAQAYRQLYRQVNS